MEVENNSKEMMMVLRLSDGKTATYQNNNAYGNQDPVEPRFFFGLCPVSLRSSALVRVAPSSSPPLEALKACSGCLSVCYAGRDEQKRDWKRHRGVCKALQPLVRQLGGRRHPLSGRPEAGGGVRAMLEGAMGRELTQFETDMIVYPRLCAVCFDGDESVLSNCASCGCVSYCSAVHRAADAAEHAKSCAHLATCLAQHAVDAAIRDLGGIEGTLRGFAPTVVSSTYEFLPVDMEDFLRSEFASFWPRARNRAIDEEHWFFLLEPAMRHLSLRLTGPLSALRGLEASGLLWAPGHAGGHNHRSHLGDSLVLHVVGARRAEAKDLTAWEVLPARLPGVSNFTIVFIGPELDWSFPFCDFEYESAALKRARPEIRVRYVFKRRSYQEACGEGKVPRADLVVALNCGFVFYESWDASIPLMLSRPGVPLVFTEYYLEDCQMNLEKVDSLVEEELEVCLAPSPNPFCSLLPARIPTGFAFRRFKRRSVVMSNDFICVVKWDKEEEGKK